MSAGKWKIGLHRAVDRRGYRIYRLKDVNAADRPKNREYYDDIVYTDALALQAMVNKLNAAGERGVR